MTDQCNNCSLKGDIKKCLATDCFQHENWYAKEQQERIDELVSAVLILENLAGRWNLCVSQDDERLLDRVLSEIKSK